MFGACEWGYDSPLPGLLFRSRLSGRRDGISFSDFVIPLPLDASGPSRMKGKAV